MYKSAIKHYGLWLAPGSLAHKLHSEGKIDELNKHLKAVAEKEKQQNKVVIKPKREETSA